MEGQRAPPFSWEGQWLWAHDGSEANGHLTLQPDGGLLTDLAGSELPGRWWRLGEGRIEVEWGVASRWAVRHTLAPARSGDGAANFRVVSRSRPRGGGAPLPEAEAWVRDPWEVRSLGWRAPSLASGRSLLRLSSPLDGSKEQLSKIENGATWSTWCPSCRRPLAFSAAPRRSVSTLAPVERGGPALFLTSPFVEGREHRCPEQPAGSGRHECFCPNCRRPVLAVLEDPPVPHRHLPSVGTWLTPLLFHGKAPERSAPSNAGHASGGPRCAYVGILYGGAGPDAARYVRDARVMGFTLRKSGTSHDLVLLHTGDLPRAYLETLGQIWTLRRVDLIDGAETLFTRHSRFRGVFTKLHAWNLVEYDRVVLVDLDMMLLPGQSIDGLFGLRAPAALWSQCDGQAHGQLIDYAWPGPFKGYHHLEPWGKSGGVNAGVVLLEPSAATFISMRREVECANHPEHIVTTSPEQDYMTRYFWGHPGWTNIDVTYNFQLHHVALRLPDRYCSTARRTKRFEDIRVVHFSAHPKPSQREVGKSVEQFLEEMLAEQEGWKLYVQHDAPTIERRNACGYWPKMELRDDGRLFEESRGWTGESEEVTVKPEAADAVRDLFLRCLRAWEDAERACDEVHGAFWPACGRVPPSGRSARPSDETASGRILGKCVKWFPARGVGVIQPRGGGEDVLVHHKNVSGAKCWTTALKVGMQVTYEPTVDSWGRPDAKHVQAEEPSTEPAPHYSYTAGARWQDRPGWYRAEAAVDAQRHAGRPAGAFTKLLRRIFAWLARLPWAIRALLSRLLLMAVAGAAVLRQHGNGSFTAPRALLESKDVDGGSGAASRCRGRCKSWRGDSGIVSGKIDGRYVELPIHRDELLVRSAGGCPALNKGWAVTFEIAVGEERAVLATCGEQEEELLLQVKCFKEGAARGGGGAAPAPAFLSFPAALSPWERKVVHGAALSLGGLSTCSRGVAPHRHVCLERDSAVTGSLEP